MQRHGPKRIYSQQSLEAWFSKLEAEWEPHFSKEALELGHEFYRDGEVREIELGMKDAIIHRKVDKRDEYAVLDWDTETPTVRSTSSDMLQAQALVVAGLHEIEELLAEEISPLPPETLGAKSNSSNGSFVASVDKLGSAAPVRKSVSAEPSVARELLLTLRTGLEGLICEVWWVGSDGQRVSAYSQTGASAAASATERSKVIGLAAYARKAHFHFKQETRAYVLSLAKEIPEFLKVALPVWKKHFTIESAPDVADLLKGVRQVEVEAHASRSRNSGMLNLKWLFKAGERLLSAEEVKLLSERVGQQVVLPGVGLVSLSAERWQTATAWKQVVADMHDGQVPPYLIFSLFNDARMRVALSGEVAAWKERVLASPPPPVTVPDWLRQYQKRGVEWMSHLAETSCHGLLADEMGLGKTVQVLTLLSARPLADRRHVVVCPASVVPVWREEAARFFPELKIEVLKNGHDFSVNPAPAIWLASYAQLRKHRELLDKTEFGYAILDEGQFIKNPDAKVTNACFAIRAQHRFVLSGTPLENRQLDLWSIFRFLLPGLLGSRAAFEAALLANRDESIKQLRTQIAPFVLRRTKGEVATELPPKVVVDLRCPLTELQRLEYARICDEGLQRLGSDLGAALREKSFGLFALLTRLRQACCDPALLPWIDPAAEESGKIQILVEKLAEVLSSGHKVVIFSQFVTFLARVRAALTKHFPDVARFELTGVTLDRQKPVQSFQTAEGSAVMLVSLKAAGTGITLHAADYVFLLDPWWNPAVEDQAIDRVHRLGQKQTVFVYRFITEGTIEERIQALKAEKRALFEKIVGGFRTEFDIVEHFNSLESLIKLAAVAEPAPKDVVVEV